MAFCNVSIFCCVFLLFKHSASNRSVNTDGLVGMETFDAAVKWHLLYLPVFCLLLCPGNTTFTVSDLVHDNDNVTITYVDNSFYFFFPILVVIFSLALLHCL